jgi:hypothetical protein
VVLWLGRSLSEKLIKHVVIDPAKINVKDFENGNWPGE